MAEAMMMQQPKNEREETVQDPIELVELGLPVKAVVIQQQQPLKEERGETGQHPVEMVELVEAVVIQQQPKEERGKTGQDLQARGDTLAKAWTDLFSYLTDFQAELTLKENLVDVAEKEIQAQRKQLEELRPTQEVENAEILKLREGVVAKERQLLQMQSHINVKDQLLRSVQSELGNQMKLNDKLNKDLVQKNSEIVRMKGELERCNSKLALKEQDGVEDSSLSKLRKENAELKMHLTFVRKALELERRSLEMERKAHDLSKQSLMTMSLSKKRENELTNFLDVMDVDDDSEEDDMNNEDSMDTDYMPPHAPTGHDYVVRKDDVAQTPSPGRSRVSSRQRKRSVRLGPPSPQPATPRKGSVASAKRLKILKSSQTKPGTRGASQDSSKESADAAKSVHVVLTKASEPSESALVLPSSSDVYFPLTLTVSDGSVVIDNTEEHAHEDAIAAQYIASEGTSEETVPATSSNEGGKTPKKILKGPLKMTPVKPDAAQLLLKPKRKKRRDKQCPICFALISARFPEHVKSHGVERPFKCPDCDLSYKRESDCDIHHRVKHEGLPRRPPHLSVGKICPVCDKVIKARFKEHMQRHTGEANYLCPRCGVGFFRRFDVRHHLQKSHTTYSKPFICTNFKCGKSYATQKTFNAHKATCVEEPSKNYK